MDRSLLIPTFEQVPYSSVIARIDNGSQGLFELTNIFLERKELEEKNVLHSAKVSRSNIYEYEIDNSSCERVLGFFKNYHLFLSKAQVKQHKAFGEVIIKDLEDLKITRASNVNRHKVAVQNCLRDVTYAEDALDKAKKNFIKAKSDLERGQNKLVVSEAAVVEAQRVNEEKKRENAGKETQSNKFSMGRMLSAFESTPEQERDKQQRKVDRRSAEVNNCVHMIFEKKQMLIEKIGSMDSTLQKANAAFQEAEKERIIKLNVCMKSFCELERAALSARAELLNTLEEAIQSQNADDDLALFIAQERNVELTHKYTYAVGLMDAHLHRRNEQAESDGYSDPSRQHAESTDSADIFSSRAAERDATGDNQGGAEDGACDSPTPGDEGDLLAAATSGSRVVASQGDLMLIGKMSAALACLFPVAAAASAGDNEARDSEALQEQQQQQLQVEDEACWQEIIFFRPTRELFLQELDEQRGRRAALSAKGFRGMSTAMKVLLDYCEAYDDAKAAMRVTNMANTFHTVIDSEEVGADGSIVHSAHKHYLQTEEQLSRHPVWRKHGFWELALREGIAAQMTLALETPVLWDELSPEALREAVINVHNIVFGQLGTLAFAMHELGLTADEVERNVLSMCRRAQLTEDQEHDLVRSVRVMYGIPVPPAPLTIDQLNFVEVGTPPPVVVAAPKTAPAPLVAVGRVIATQQQPAASAHGGEGASDQQSQHTVPIVAKISSPLPPSAEDSSAALPPPLPASSAQAQQAPPAKRPSVTPYVPDRAGGSSQVKSPAGEGAGGGGGWGGMRAGSGDSSFINSFFGRSGSSSSNSNNSATAGTTGKGVAKGSSAAPQPLQQPSKPASTPVKNSAGGSSSSSAAAKGADYDDFFAEL